jgi:hypothetical protein
MGKKFIQIISSRTYEAQNLAALLKSEAGCECLCLHAPVCNSQDQLFFLFDSKSFRNGLDAYVQAVLSAKGRVAIYNVEPEAADVVLTLELVRRGLHGIFFARDELAVIVRGIRAILNGELWLPRKLMSRWVLEGVNGDAVGSQISNASNG